jgi:DNA-binding transcriptional LysR family regulator
MDDRPVDVDLRQLRYFITMAEELHFSRAAKRLHLDQPTLSRHIRRLEEKLGVKLFDRTTRSVTLTGAGEAFLGKAREVIDAAAAAVSAARDAASGRTGLLRVGMMVQVAEPLRSAAFNLFGERYPEVELKPMSYPFIDPACGLESGETDVALVWLPILHPEIETERLFEEPRYFIVANDHRLARKRAIRREDVEDERFFSWPESWGLSPTAMAWGDSLVRGLAISTAPASAKTYYPWPGITFIRAHGIDPAIVAVAWRRDENNPLVTNFLEIMREVRDAGRTGSGPDPHLRGQKSMA